MFARMEQDRHRREMLRRMRILMSEMSRNETQRTAEAAHGAHDYGNLHGRSEDA